MTRTGRGLALDRGLALAALLPLLLASPLSATNRNDDDKGPLGHLEWRNVGPVNMSGRVADVEGVAGDPRVVWVGAASGGVWKTTDGGLTFKPVFDDEPIASIGAIGVAPSNPDVVYVGTGESAVRNSVSFGNGVYRTTDGGQSWSYLGLAGTRHVSKVLVHPTDPDTVWVGALGSAFGPNEDRGVYLSTDGGKSWEKTLYLDDRHGVADMALDPTNPKVLFAALWHFERKPWAFTSGDEEGGVWRSVDGGRTWKKLEKGLPKLMGRTGLAVAPSDPRVVYVIAETNAGTLFRSDDRGDTFTKVTDESSIVSRGFYYTHVRVDPADADRVYAVASRLQVSIDGGKSWRRIARNTHVDFHALWIDPADPSRLWQGQDGGVAVSYDRGETWEPLRNLPIAQFYQVFADDRRPFYYLGGGLQDNGTWYGPSRTREPAGILPDDWRMMSFGDAFFVVAHPTVEDLFLSESQGGHLVRTDMRTRQQIAASPQPERNDGGPDGALTYRFNWNAPIVASPHDPAVVYFAGNAVFRSADFGDHWQAISPDLTTDDPAKEGVGGGPVWPENTTAEYHCTIISFAESPAQAGVLWAGTDDGNLQVSRDGGAGWTNVAGHVPGLPAFSPVSHVEPSRTAAGRAYAAFDRHMFDDFRPLLYETEDFGASWRRLATKGIPDDAWVWVVREDPRNPQLLYAGTELGLYASWDGGGAWQRLHLGNLPTVAVHDVLVHPRTDDLILGTHGRALWIFDDATPLQRYGDAQKALAAGDPAYLFDVRPALRFPTRFTRYGLGDKELRAPNPPSGALITYDLAESLEPPEGEEGEDGVEGDAEGTAAGAAAGGGGENAAAAGGDEAAGEGGKAAAERIEIEILDAAGTVVRTLKPEQIGKKQGLNRVAWDLSHEPARPRKEREDDEASEFFGPPRGPEVLPGTYTVRLTVDGKVYEKPVEVGVDPLVEVSAEALAAQHAAALRLTAMHSAANDALRALDAVGQQRKSLEATLKAMKRTLPDAVTESWKATGKTGDELSALLARAEGKPFWSQGPALGDRIGGLERDVASAFAAPTAAQAAYQVKLEGELADALGRLRRFLTEDLPQLNAALAAAGLPQLLVPEPVEMPADGG
jgi:photosystem II stability/assembly factor-like uncharacterized protein